MCGIFFYLKNGILSAAQMKDIERDFQMLEHRGPDESRVR